MFSARECRTGRLQSVDQALLEGGAHQLKQHEPFAVCKSGPSSLYAANRAIEQPVSRANRPFRTDRVQPLVLTVAAAQALKRE